MTCKANDMFLGETGVRFVHQFLTDTGPFDLTGYVSAEVVFAKGATRVTRTCSVESPPTLGTIYYVTSAGDIEIFGDWQYQFIAVLPGGVTRKSPVYPLSVKKSL